MAAPEVAAASSAVFHVLVLEAAAVEVVRELTDAGVRTLLLKGPVTNRWLYGDPLARAYGDVDLLVDPQCWSQARAVLRQTLDCAHEHALWVHRPDNEEAWIGESRVIDLHRRLAGVPAAMEQKAFEQLWRDRQPFCLHRHDLPTLSDHGRMVHLVLHAAQSANDARALHELNLGLTLFGPDAWAHAAALAVEWGAQAAYAEGLRRAGLPAPLSPSRADDAVLEAWLRAHGGRIETLSVLNVRAARRLGDGRTAWQLLSREGGRPAQMSLPADLRERFSALANVLRAPQQILEAQRALAATK